MNEAAADLRLSKTLSTPAALGSSEKKANQKPLATETKEPQKQETKPEPIKEVPETKEQPKPKVEEPKPKVEEPKPKVEEAKPKVEEPKPEAAKAPAQENGVEKKEATPAPAPAPTAAAVPLTLEKMIDFVKNFKDFTHVR